MAVAKKTKKTDSGDTVKTPVKKAVKTVKAKSEPKVKPEPKAPKVPKAAKVVEAPEPSAEKQEIINEFRVKEGDTGSPEVQVALLTKRLEKLAVHLKSNPSDNHSRRGLLGIVSKRRRLLNYLEKKDEIRYKEVVKKLGLGK